MLVKFQKNKMCKVETLRRKFLEKSYQPEPGKNTYISPVDLNQFLMCSKVTAIFSALKEEKYSNQFSKLNHMLKLQFDSFFPPF